MALQKIFVKTVQNYFPTIFPSHLECIDQFDIGQVLVYKQKPRLLMPWRAHHLQLTGYPITKLLASGDSLPLVTSGSVIFTTGPATKTRDIQFDVEVGLKEALSKLGIAADVKEDKKVTISTDFGKVTHVASNLLDLLSMAKHKVDTNHPIIREAMNNGETLFVVSSVYSSEKLTIQIQVTERAGEKAGGSKNDSTSENVTKEITSSDLITRNQSTCIGFLLLRLTIDSQGHLIPMLNTGLKSNPKIGEETDSANYHQPHEKPHSPLFRPHDRNHMHTLYTHSSIDIGGFSSESYSSIMMEIAQMVAPLVSNKSLVEALKSFIRDSFLNNKLTELVQFLHTIEGSPGDHTPPQDLEAVVQCLSKDDANLSAELMALQITIEACLEFPPHLTKEMIALNQQKRDLLLNQIKMTPYGSGSHVFIDQGPYSDPDLYPIMMQNGFSVVGGRLTFQHSSEDDDKLAAIAVILIALPV